MVLFGPGACPTNRCLLHKPTAQNAPLIHNCFLAAVLEGFLYSPGRLNQSQPLAEKRDPKDTRVGRICETGAYLGHKSPRPLTLPSLICSRCIGGRGFSCTPQPIAQAVLRNAAGSRSCRHSRMIGSTLSRWPRHGTYWPSSAQATS